MYILSLSVCQCRIRSSVVVSRKEACRTAKWRETWGVWLVVIPVTVPYHSLVVLQFDFCRLKQRVPSHTLCHTLKKGLSS